MKTKDKKAKAIEKIADKILEDFADFCKTQVCRYHSDGWSYGCDLYFTSKETEDFKDRKNPDLYNWNCAQDNMEPQGVTYLGRIKGEGLMYRFPDAEEIKSNFKGDTEEEIDEHFIDFVMETFWESPDLQELRQTLIYFIETGEIE